MESRANMAGKLDSYPEHNLVRHKNSKPIDELLRARLRIVGDAGLRLKMLRMVMHAVDAITRTMTGHSFFALRETEQGLVDLDGLAGQDFVRALLAKNGGTQIIPHGLENIPTHGPVIIGATHSIGTFDYIAHAAVLLDHRPDLKVVANREAARFLGPERIIAVDLDKKDKVLTARQTRAGMLAHLQVGGALLIFGSGRVPDMTDGLLVEPPWRAGVTRMSSACEAPIVPASADMRNSPQYYRTRKLARVLSGGNKDFGRMVASLRYASELLVKLGGSYDVYYGPIQQPGTSPEKLKALAEGLIPGLYIRS